MAYSTFLTVLLASPLTAAVNLYVASYGGNGWAGNVTTLSLTQTPNSSYSLTQTHSFNTSTNSPSWITLDRPNNVLYLIDRGLNTPNGSLAAYQTSPTGELTEISRLKAQVGGVYGAIFGSGQALAVPHYTGGLLQTYHLYKSGEQPTLIESFNFNTPDFKAGPVAARQDAPHPHQTIIDPTQQFILVPDLGTDLVRVFSIDQKTLKLRQQAPLKTSPGYGPRHGVFSHDKISGSYKFYLVGELAGAVTVYSASYGSAGLSFAKIASYGTLDSSPNLALNPDGSSKVAPAAINITPDGSTLIVSNRNDASFGTSPPTDSLATFSISKMDGTLTRLPLISTYGSSPRSYAINKAGTLLAIVLQSSGSVVILGKNQASGLFDQKAASIGFGKGASSPVCVVWDE